MEKRKNLSSIVGKNASYQRHSWWYHITNFIWKHHTTKHSNAPKQIGVANHSHLLTAVAQASLYEYSKSYHIITHRLKALDYDWQRKNCLNSVALWCAVLFWFSTRDMADTLQCCTRVCYDRHYIMQSSTTHECSICRNLSNL